VTRGRQSSTTSATATANCGRAAMPKRNELEPMYSEIEAARRLGIKPRSLRTEREAERITHKKVAGKIMYRHSDLVAWQRKGETCREDAPIKGRGSSSSRERDSGNPSGTSGGAKTAAPASTAPGLVIADQLIRSSRAGYSKKAAASKSRKNAAPVVRLIPR